MRGVECELWVCGRGLVEGFEGVEVWGWRGAGSGGCGGVVVMGS